MKFELTGIIAAALTPMRPGGGVDLEAVPNLVDHLERSGADGVYICGSTGEGMSLSSRERRDVAEAFVRAAKGRMKTVVQVGHNALCEARDLAAHAAEIGADAVSATAPSYFKVGSADILVECMAEIAAGAPNLPFYYYHIPTLTGAAIDMVEFLPAAAARIENLAGMKYTTHQAFEYQACLNLDGGRFDVPWGSDEMLLSALVVGARGAIGSTYNVAAPLYRGIIDAFDSGDIKEARRRQLLSVRMIRTFFRYPFLAALKEILRVFGVECGGCRMPQKSLSPGQAAALRRDLEEMGFFEWCGIT